MMRLISAAFLVCLHWNVETEWPRIHSYIYQEQAKDNQVMKCAYPCAAAFFYDLDGYSFKKYGHSREDNEQSFEHPKLSSVDACLIKWLSSGYDGSDEDGDGDNKERGFFIEYFLNIIHRLIG